MDAETATDSETRDEKMGALGRRALGFVRREAGALLGLAAPSFLALWALEALGLWLGVEEDTGIQVLMFDGARFAIVVPFITAWCRFVSRAERRSDPERPIHLGWKAAENRVFLLGLLLYFLPLSAYYVLPPFLIGREIHATVFFASLLALAVMQGFCLAVPAAAVGEPLSLGRGWEAVRSRFWSFVWTITWLVVVVSIPFLLAWDFAELALPPGWSLAVSAGLIALMDIVFYAVMMAFATMVLHRRVRDGEVVPEPPVWRHLGVPSATRSMKRFLVVVVAYFAAGFAYELAGGQEVLGEWAAKITVGGLAYYLLFLRRNAFRD